MIEITKELDISLPYTLGDKYDINDILFFDIETTGFSAEKCTLYLIGCIYYRYNRWNLIQWFADNTADEKDTLLTFFEFLKSFNTVIHYNGDNFDIPYLMKKCTQYNLSYNFNNIESIDMYKRIMSIRKFLTLDSYRLKGIERFVGIHREDIYTGGELIDVYLKYLVTKEQDAYNSLILHNEEDLIGMLNVLDILSYWDIFNSEYSVASVNKTSESIVIQLTYKNKFPRPLEKKYDFLELFASDNSLIIKINILYDTLKYYHKNYKDYYYLPLEDMAIHKSVGSYVARKHKKKATATTCYIKQTGSFLPQYEPVITPNFKYDYKDIISYFEYNNDLFDDTSLLDRYISNLLENIRK